MAGGSSSAYTSDDDALHLHGKGHQESDSDDSNESPDSLALHISKLSLGRKKKKLLIFNLNGFLVHRAHVRDTAKTPRNRSPDGKFRNQQLVYRRPYSEAFLRFCLEDFEVGIWSSAIERNVQAVLKIAVGELQSKLLFVWDQEYCPDYGFKCLENKAKPMFFKELDKVWNHFEHSSKGPFTASNTLLIDDKPYKGLLNPPNTGIYPSTYDYEDLNDNMLEPKGLLGGYLEGLAEADDVPSYVESHPFGQPAIKSGHSDWRIYSRVLRRINVDLSRCDRSCG